MDDNSPLPFEEYRDNLLKAFRMMGDVRKADAFEEVPEATLRSLLGPGDKEWMKDAFRGGVYVDPTLPLRKRIWNCHGEIQRLLVPFTFIGPGFGVGALAEGVTALGWIMIAIGAAAAVGVGLLHRFGPRQTPHRLNAHTIEDSHQVVLVWAEHRLGELRRSSSLLEAQRVFAALLGVVHERELLMAYKAEAGDPVVVEALDVLAEDMGGLTAQLTAFTVEEALVEESPTGAPARVLAEGVIARRSAMREISHLE